VVNFLQASAALIDLSGRLRYLHRDALDIAANELAEHPVEYEQLIDLLAKYRATMGAIVMSEALLDPPPGNPERLVLLNAPLKLKILKLIAVSGAVELLPTLVALVKAAKQSPHVRLAAVETIRAIGLPQQQRGGDAEPPPAITPAQLYEQLLRIPGESFTAADKVTLEELKKWLDARMRKGIAEPRFRYGRIEVQPGDWLLMRNPSPYNSFTDLSPGLFTHVGIVTAETGKDGIRRMVIVDLPERGTTIPATNVETFLDRTLHYSFLRHEHPAVAAQLGQAAADCIGNASLFDLNFRTDRVAEMADKPLAGQPIHTYCAGFLLLCAQTTKLPRDEFFPLPERPAGERVVQNFKQLGLTFGDNFISPTGALFSPRFELVGRREPMYDPRREIEEAIFDHFAHRSHAVPLVESPDMLQALRTKMAEASKNNPLLAKALAATANVSENLDLVAAAKMGAVVEALDEIAYGNSAAYFNARLAITEGPLPAPVVGRTAEQVAMLAKLRTGEHAALAKRWDAQQLSARGLRIELVNDYIQHGKRQLDERFFQAALAPEEKASGKE